METVKFKNFLGINNRVAGTELHTKDGSWVRDAVNVDIDNSGAFRRRRVLAPVVAMSQPHSLFEDFLVRSNTLYRITLPTYAETMARFLSSNSRMCYAKVGDLIFMSNGTDRLRTNLDGEIVPWGLPTPSAPTLTAISGAMSNGEYLVSISYANCEEESGLSSMSRVETDGGVRVALPPYPVEGATHINVYVSGNAGSVPLLAATVEIGTALVDITEKVVGREGLVRIEDVLPAGDRVFEYNGRLCTTKGDTLYYSIPYKHGYYLPASGFIRFESDIQIATCNQMGIYIAVKGRTMFLQGTDADKIEIVRDLFPYGGVPGTEFDHPKKSKIGWFGEMGLILGDNNGEVEAKMSEVVELTAPTSGTSVVLTDGGIDRVVSCGWAMNLATSAVTRYAGFSATSASGNYVTDPTGLHALAAGGSVDAVINLGQENFGVEEEKHLPACYLTVASDDLMSLQVTIASGDSFVYDSRTYSETLDVIRVDPGKGLRSNTFVLEVMNTNGCDFNLASVSFPPTVSKRRI